jgi:alanine dehydrogenase
MKVGAPEEIEDHEFRVGLVPASVGELVRRGHGVFVEAGAGAGARIERFAEEVFQAAELIMKVKEPQAVERGWMHAAREDPRLRNGLNVHAGKLTHRAVSKALGLDFTAIDLALAA